MSRTRFYDNASSIKDLQNKIHTHMCHVNMESEKYKREDIIQHDWSNSLVMSLCEQIFVIFFVDVVFLRFYIRRYAQMSNIYRLMLRLFNLC